MNDRYEYLWTTEKDKYVLLDHLGNRYSIFNIIDNMELIIEDDEKDKFVIKQMRLNNRIIRAELLKYMLDKRPIPRLIGYQSGKAVYRCPDSGEKFELNIEHTFDADPEYDIAIRWSKDIPLTKQIINLRKIYSGISISTPELFHIAKSGKEYTFSIYCRFGEGYKICNEGKKMGLDIFLIPK